MPDKAVTSFDDATLSGVRVPLITVYRSPLDYPGQYVARLWRILPGKAEPTPTVIIAETLEVLRGKIPVNMTIFGRNENDDPAIVECWM